MNRSLHSPIEELMIRKLGKICERFSTARHKDKILMKLLKEALIPEVHVLLRQNGMGFPPFDPFKISCIKDAQIRVIYLPKEEIGADGSIETCENGFIIKIDKNLRDRSNQVYRLRTTMAHELMHTFFYDVLKPIPNKIGFRHPQKEEFWMEEELCGYLTREFLVPIFSLNELILKKADLLFPSIPNIEFLKSIFVISSDVIAYRMIKDVSLWNAIFIKFVRGGQIYKAKTRLKYKSNKIFDVLRLPDYVPLKTSDIWLNKLSNLCMSASRDKEVKDTVNFKGVQLTMESKIETKNPVSIITIISEAKNGN